MAYRRQYLSRDLRRHNETVLGTLEVGDLVEFDRGFIIHFAIYVGDEELVHLTEEDRIDTRINTGWVKKENFWSVAEKSTAKKNNNDRNKRHDGGTARIVITMNRTLQVVETIRRPFPGKEIKKRALSNVGLFFYNLLAYNCENFANWCRYGISESSQANAVLKGNNLTEIEATFWGKIASYFSWFMSFFSSSSNSSSASNSSSSSRKG